MASLGMACGSSTKPEAASTPAQCPTAVAVSTSTPDIDIVGQFSAECVRGLVGFQFQLPTLPGYLAPVYQWSIQDPSLLLVQYNPEKSGAMTFHLQIVGPTGVVGFPGTDAATSPNGHDVALGDAPSLGGFTGSWEDGDVTYMLSALGAEDSPSVRRLILAVADSVLDGGEVRSGGD